MNKKTIKIELTPVTGVRQLQKHDGKAWVRRNGQLYFHEIDSGFILHTVSDRTPADWLISQIEEGRIWVTKEVVMAEGQ